MTTPNIRVIVDWNDDAFFEPTDGQSLPNLVPTPLSYVDIGTTAHASGSTFTKAAELTDYGVAYYRVVTGTNVFGGMRFGDDGSAVDDIPITASANYRAAVWIRGVSSYAGVNMAIGIQDQGGAGVGTSSTFTLTADWQRVTVNVAMGVGDTHVKFIVRKDNVATNITFDVTGFMLVAGTTAPTYFNAGDTYSAYEDISTDVLQASWSQRINTKTRIPDEGTLTLTLDNSTRKYTPRYASSVLYGAFKHGLRVRVEVQRITTGAWVTMWAGWITGYDITPGKTIGDKQTTIKATQGMFNLDAVPLQDNLQENVTFDDVLPNILYSGWYPPTDPHVFVLGKSTLGESWLPAIADFSNILDTGITEFPLVGDGWSDTDTRASKVLKDLMEVEQGWIYLDRNGRMNFFSRERIQWNVTADATVNLDSQAIPGEYAFAPAEINSVNLTYFPSGESTDQILWTRRGTKRVRARDQKRVDAKFEYEEGTKITVKSINAFGDGGTDSTLSATIEGGDVYDSRYYYATVELRNGKGVITIYNQGPVDAYFSITLKGTIEVNANSEQIQVIGDTTDNIRSIPPIKNKLLKDEDMATDLGNYIISQHGSDYDEFRSFDLVSRDSTWLERQLDIYTGAVVSLTEYQTAVSAKKHFVVGAQHTWQPGKLNSTFSTTKVDETEYWILGTSALSHSTVLAY